MSESRKTMICSQCGVKNYNWKSRCQNCNTLLHEEDNDINIAYHRSWDKLEVTAIFFGIVGAGALALFMWLILAFASGHITDPLGWLAIKGTGLFVLGSVLIARKWSLIGGILLIVEGLLPLGFTMWSVVQTPSVFNFLFFLSLIPGIPSIASEIIFLYSLRAR